MAAGQGSKAGLQAVASSAPARGIDLLWHVPFGARGGVASSVLWVA